MGKVGRALARLLVALATIQGSTALGARQGSPTVLEQVPADRGEELGFVARPQVVGGVWPAPLLERVKGQLGGRTLLLVGRTDPIGPKALNRALGLQYAAEAGRGLQRALGLDGSRIACASAGEDSSGEPGVLVYGWKTTGARREAQALNILEPGRELGPLGRLWAIWQPGPSAVLWRPGGGCDGLDWILDPSSNPLVLPYPARCREGALGAAYSAGELPVAAAAPAAAREDPALALVLDARESWSARFTGSLPKGSPPAVVWAGGVPYPVRPALDGSFTVDVALLPERAVAYVQASPPDGRIVVGPAAELPKGDGEPPALIAVLVWDSADTDLDLYAFAGGRQSNPQDPDPRISETAAPGARILFDGNGERPASALAVEAGTQAEVEARWYSALVEGEATAWLYVFKYPGDRLLREGRILGPRRLSGQPLAARWPAFVWKGE